MISFQEFLAFIHFLLTFYAFGTALVCLLTGLYFAVREEFGESGVATALGVAFMGVGWLSLSFLECPAGAICQ